MKNFKKVFFIGVTILILLIYIINIYLEKRQYEDIDLNEIEIIEKNDTKIQDEKNYIVLHITGEVKNTGIIKIAEGSRLMDAIEAAGGVTENANLNRINLAYVLKDGQKIYVPSIYDEGEKEYVTQNIGENILDDFTLKNTEKVNINMATQTELETLSGIGPSTAQKIINYRNENGKFKTIEEIKNVPGIAESKFQSIKNEICV